MRTVGSRELKNRLGRYLGIVSKGESILITDRGKPVAKLVSAEPHPKQISTIEERLRELEAAGHLRLAPGKLRRIKPVPAKGKTASQMIIDDRR
jgi:prevent-host-death family protein